MIRPFLFLVLSIASALSAPAHEAVDNTCRIEEKRLKSGAGETPSDDDQYIVRFKSYLEAEDHHARLAAVFPGEGSSWQWVPRINKAAKHPTDFGLIKLTQARHDERGGNDVHMEPSMASGCDAGTGSPREGLSTGSRSMLDLLSHVPFVRDVHPDKRFTGKVRPALAITPAWILQVSYECFATMILSSMTF